MHTFWGILHGNSKRISRCETTVSIYVRFKKNDRCNKLPIEIKKYNYANSNIHNIFRCCLHSRRFAVSFVFIGSDLTPFFRCLLCSQSIIEKLASVWVWKIDKFVGIASRLIIQLKLISKAKLSMRKKVSDHNNFALKIEYSNPLWSTNYKSRAIIDDLVALPTCQSQWIAFNLWKSLKRFHI